jgi:hypothetical protein
MCDPGVRAMQLLQPVAVDEHAERQDGPRPRHGPPAQGLQREAKGKIIYSYFSLIIFTNYNLF